MTRSIPRRRRPGGRTPARAGVVGLLGLLGAVGCVEDTPASSVSGPQALVGDGLASARDEDRGVWVVFGGGESFEGKAPTWTLDGGGWRVAALGGPTVRSRAAMAWDPTRRQVVLFGGRGDSDEDEQDDASLGDDPLGDTWAWSGEAWARIEGAGPPGRWGHALVWVPTRRALLLVGGAREDCRGPSCQDEWWLGAEGWTQAR